MYVNVYVCMYSYELVGLYYDLMILFDKRVLWEGCELLL